MALTRYNPQGLTPWFDFDRIFEDFDRALGLQPNKSGGFAPAVDIYEDEKNVVLSVELPGVDEKQLDIRVQDNHLTIKGERRFENEEKREHYHRVERRYGSFQRTFALPETVDDENIKANYDKGVLKLTLPKLERPKNARVVKING